MHAAGLPCIFRSVDGGYNWEDITYNLPRAGMSTMAVNPHTGELLRGSPFGTWVFPTPYESENLIYDKSISMMPSVLYGDVSGNGGISAYDAALAAQYAVGLISLTAEQRLPLLMSAAMERSQAMMPL